MSASFGELESELLEQRPQARTIKLEDLMAEVRRGRVRVPAFQRALKWGRDDAKLLLDSMYRGYPVGTLLFWETRADPGELHFGNLAISGAGRDDAWWVVDGQQRITSLARTLLPHAGEPDSFALYFDLDKGQFIAPPKEGELAADAARWLPSTELLDSERLIQWILAHPLASESRRQVAIMLGKRLREYDIPAYIVPSRSESTLREIFARSNSSGKRLEASEVFDALHGARSTLRPATISQIADGLNDLAFGRIDEKILYRLLRVLQGADVADRAGQRRLRLEDGQAEAAYAETAAAAREVVVFLKREAGIGHYELLPYKQPLVTLGKFFHTFRQPSDRSRELLVRWLWRGALSGAHRGDTVSTRRALDLIQPGHEARSVQGLLAMVGTEAEQLPSLSEPFNFRHAASKLQALALLDLAPRDLWSGELLTLPQLFGAHDSSTENPLIQLLEPGKNDEKEPFLSVANRLVHPRRPGVRRRVLEVRDPTLLASHGIDDDCLAQLREGKSEGFLILRTKRLLSRFSSFFLSRAQWGATDRPALDDLLVPDDEEIHETGR